MRDANNPSSLMDAVRRRGEALRAPFPRAAVFWLCRMRGPAHALEALWIPLVAIVAASVETRAGPMVARGRVFARHARRIWDGRRWALDDTLLRFSDASTGEKAR